MQRWLVVAAEAREFAGILRRTSGVQTLAWPAAAFARQCDCRGERWLLIANGPGPRLVQQVLETKRDVDGMMSIGLCGALDPMLRIGDIVVSGEVPKGAKAPFVRGEVLSMDRVAATAGEKRDLRASTGAAVVEMESAAVHAKAQEWGVPFRCVKAVSDTAEQNLPLDFNLYRDTDGRFARLRIAGAALARPFTALPDLVRLDRNCRRAADQLGAFLADCQLEF